MAAPRPRRHTRPPHAGVPAAARRRRLAAAALVTAATLSAGGCARRAEPGPPATPAGAMALGDGVTASSVAAGVVHRTYTLARGPQVVHVLDVDRTRCWTVSARKAGGTAVGRAGTLSLVAGLHDSATVAGGVNADFFTFSPPGVPVSAHVERGRVVAGPSARPVLALDSTGAPWIGTLRVEGAVLAIADSGGATRDSLPLAAVNRPAPDALALFDAAWGARTDSTPGRRFVALAPSGVGRYRGEVWVNATVASVDSGAAAPVAGWLLALGERAPDSLRARVAALRPRTPVTVRWRLAPFHPDEAVGGFPILLRDGAIDPGIDSAGSAGFRGPHPRTAVGIADGGRRLLLVTVDGRQPGYSVGMTLRELAELLRALGARDALNLDGGGSTTFVVAPPAGAPRIANRPSDSAGERPVGNALAVVHGCAAADGGAP